MTMTTKAAQRRYDAIGSLFGRFCNDETDHFTRGDALQAFYRESGCPYNDARCEIHAQSIKVASEKDREQIADAIAELVDLGRTTRWQNTIHNWALMVRESESSSLDWAFKQGSIWANNAAE